MRRHAAPDDQPQCQSYRKSDATRNLCLLVIEPDHETG